MDDRTDRRIREWRRQWRRATRLDPDELDELVTHLVDTVEGLRAEGATEDEAVDEAIRRIGLPEEVAEEYGRSRSRLALLGQGLRDTRYGIRQLRAHPVFSLVAMASIAIAIASNTLAFSIVNALLLRDPGYGDSARLAEVYTGSIDDPQNQSVASWPIVDDLRGVPEIFEGVIGYEPLFGRMALDGAYTPVFGEVVSADFFDVLRVSPALGRGFSDDDERLRTGVAVLSWTTWQRRFDGDREVIGRTIDVNGEILTVIGVAPERFQGALPALAKHVWIPVWTLPLGREADSGAGPPPGADRDRWLTQIKARLRPGVSAEEAEAVLIGMVPELQASHPESYADVRFRVIPTDDVALSPGLDGVAFSLAGGVMGVVGMVLLVASMNLAGFLLARGADRWSELRVRQALGASRTRLMGQLFVESLTLAVLGGVAGLGLCRVALAAMARVQLPIPILLEFDFSIDRSVLLFTLAATLGAAVLFGLIPAWRSTRQAGGLATRGARGVTGSTRLRGVLLTGQVAVSLVFLVTGGLLFRSLIAEARIDPGFRDGGAAILTLEMASAGYGGEALPAFLDEMRAAVGARPELDAVAFTSRVPMGTVTSSVQVGLPGAEAESEVQAFDVSSEYLDVMGIPLAQGRGFDAGDRRDSEPVVVVSASFLERFGAEGAAVGASIEIDGSPARIVGVARDVRVERPREGPTPHLYRPLEQSGAFLLSVVATSGDGSPPALPALRSALDQVDATVPIWSSSTMEDHLALKLMGPRIAAALVVSAAGVALFLTLIGVFGSVRYAAARRAREMAVRLALGATPEAVTRLMVGSMVRVIGIGAILGLTVSLAMAPALRSLLFGVRPFDPWSFFAAAVLLGGTAVLAALLPARRAGRTELVTLLNET